MKSSARKKEELEIEQAEGWTEAERATAPSAVPDEGDAISELLGESAAPQTARRYWPRLRNLRWALLVVPVLAVVIPVSLWFQYQSQHVTSKNAAVRGHLAEIGTRIDGLIESVEVDVGDRVRKGDVLVRLASRHLLAEVQESRAEIDGLERSIEVERMSIDLERREAERQLREVRARVTAAKAQAEAARVEAEEAYHIYETRKSLSDREGAISSEEVRAAESEWKAAQARFEEANANAVAAQSSEEQVHLSQDALTIRERKIGVAESDLLRAQARLTRAEADFDGAAIRAPEDGAIVRRIIQPGGSVEVGQPIISMWLGSDVWVEAWINEEDIGDVRLGSRARVTLQSSGGREFTGVVDKIGLATDLEIPDYEVPQPRGKRMSGAPVVGVRIRLDDPPLDLLPGLSAVVAIEKEV